MSLFSAVACASVRVNWYVRSTTGERIYLYATCHQGWSGHELIRHISLRTRRRVTPRHDSMGGGQSQERVVTVEERPGEDGEPLITVGAIVVHCFYPLSIIM